jgi:hypothetical protein
MRCAWLPLGLLLAAVSCGGCGIKHSVEVEPTHHTLKVEPIHMTVDVNLRVQEELDRFYGEVAGETPPQSSQGGAS